MSAGTSRVERAVGGCLDDVGLPSSGESLVLGLSGGPDSVALLDALLTVGCRRGFTVIAAHLDHELRPDSKADVAFCADLCRRLGVELLTGVVDVSACARRRRCGIEQAAREERYSFLRGVKERSRSVAVAVAHTRDDQAETFLMRLLRGAGRQGLAAMRPINGDVLRPMLRASREDVIDHLRRRRLQWREDSSNRDLALVRNRIRHELLPYLEARFNPRLRETLARTAEQLAEEDEVLSALGERLLAEIGRTDDSRIALLRQALNERPRAIARRAVRSALALRGGLKGVCAAHVETVLDIASAPHSSGKRLPLPGLREASFSFQEILLGPRRGSQGGFSVSLPVPGRVELAGGLSFEAEPCARDALIGQDEALLALGEDERLEVRTRRPGDRIRVRGRDVSLRRYLMRRHVPPETRNVMPLVAVEDRVLWIPGMASASPIEGRCCVRVAIRGLGTAVPMEDLRRLTA